MRRIHRQAQGDEIMVFEIMDIITSLLHLRDLSRGEKKGEQRTLFTTAIQLSRENCFYLRS